MPTLTKQITQTEDARSLPDQEKKALAIDAAGGLPPADRRAVVQAIGVPDQGITNFIWAVIVVAIVIVLLGSAGVMMLVFAETGKLEPGVVLTIFTSAMGFVGGLLVESPLTKNKA